MVAAGVADEVLIQLSYAIGVAEPVSIYVNTFGRSKVKLTDSEIARKIKNRFKLTPQAIENRLQLRQPMYTETAAYGHFGREPQIVTKTFRTYNYAHRRMETKSLDVELFTWEKLDLVDEIKSLFGL